MQPVCMVWVHRQHIRESDIGWYSATISLSGLVAGIVAGPLWDMVNHQAVFIYGAVFSMVGIIALIILIPAKLRSDKI